jgi:hypothetical protein
MSQDFKWQQKKLDDLGCQTSFEVLTYPEVEKRTGHRRLGERRIFNDPDYKGPERRSGLDRRLGEDRRKQS